MTAKKKIEESPNPAPPVVATELLRRNRPPKDDSPRPEPPPSVSAGAVAKVVDYTFNPSRDKIREVTIVDRIQGRLFPQLDMVNMMRNYCIEIASFREDPAHYEKTYKRKDPKQPDAIDELVYRTSQWQKSIGGKNMQSAVDIALAETETQGSEQEEPLGGHGFEDE